MNLYEGTIFVVTQDSTLVSWGFDSFGKYITFHVSFHISCFIFHFISSFIFSFDLRRADTCADGTGWSAEAGRCEPCPPGQHKQVLETRAKKTNK